MPDYPCQEFSPQRRREDRIALDPPLTLMPAWSLSKVASVPLLVGDNAILRSNIEKDLVVRVARHDRKSAEQVWAHEVSASVPTSGLGSCLIWGQTVVVGGGGELQLFELQTGRLLERVGISGLILDDACVLGSLLVATGWESAGGPFLGCCDLSRGALCWKRPVSIRAGLLSAWNGVVIYAEEHEYRAVDVESGADRWTFSVAEIGRHEDVVTRQPAPGVVQSSAIVVDGRAIGAVRAHQVLSLDLETGELRWSHRLKIKNPHTVSHYPDGRIYVMDFHDLEILEGATGELVAALPVREGVARMTSQVGFLSSLAVTDNVIYCATRNEIVAVDKRRGTIAWSSPTTGAVPPRGGPVALDGRLYVVDIRGNLRVFEGRR